MQPAQLAVRAADAVDAAEVVRLAQQLIRIPSHYPGPGEAAVVEFLGNYLADRGFETRRYDVAPGRPNLIADLGSGPGGVIVEGHTDVVTPGDPATWSIPPYEGAIRDSRLHGRGAADMKGGVAAAVVAAGAVRGFIGIPPRPVRLALLADEEGMMFGVKAFIRDGHARGFVGAIVCEPEENELCLWQKGAIRYRVLFKGKMAHGALPHTGRNPIPPAARYAVLAQTLEAELQHGGPHPYLGWPYVTPTVFIASAGEGQHNVIPDVAELRLDVRTIPRTGHAAIGVRLAELLTEAVGDRGVEATLELVDDRPATETPGDAGVVRAVERALRLLGQPVRYGGVLGATDGTFLHATAGLPIVTLGPGGRLGPHQVDESVSVDEIVTAARVYAASLVLLCSAEEGG